MVTRREKGKYDYKEFAELLSDAEVELDKKDRPTNSRYNNDAYLLNKKEVTCYNCNKKGHISKDCKSKRNVL
jgi:hypothetical protein